MPCDKWISSAPDTSPTPAHDHVFILAALKDLLALHERNVQKILVDHLQLLGLEAGSLGAPTAQWSWRTPSGNPEDVELRETPSLLSGALLSVDKAKDKESKHHQHGGQTAQASSLRQGTGTKEAGPEISQEASRNTWSNAWAFDVAEPKTQASKEEVLEELATCQWRRLVQIVVQSHFFKIFIELMIFTNGAVLGLQQLGKQPEGQGVRLLSETQYDILDVVFTIVFASELLLRLLAEGCSFFSVRSDDICWNLFDLFLVLAACVEVVFKYTSPATPMVDLSTGRVLRMMRFVRVVRVLRVLRFFKNLRVMVLSIAGSLKPLFFALILLLLLMYVVSVILMDRVQEELDRLGKVEPAGKELKDLKGHFGTLQLTAFTLFVSITGGNDWADAFWPLFKVSKWLGCFFFSYICFATFCVLNIFTGIFVEEAKSKTSEDEENMLIRELDKRKRFIDEARRFFDMADKDNSGDLSWPEFRNILGNLRMQTLLQDLGIDVVACGKRNVFEMFDFDNNGRIEINEFTSGLQRLRGSARSIEVAAVKFEQNKILQKVEVLDRITKELMRRSSHLSSRQNGSGGSHQEVSRPRDLCSRMV